MLNISIRSHVVEMKKGYGSFGGGSATLEKSKLDLSQSSSKVKQEVCKSGFCVRGVEWSRILLPSW